VSKVLWIMLEMNAQGLHLIEKALSLARNEEHIACECMRDQERGDARGKIPPLDWLVTTVATVQAKEILPIRDTSCPEM
jgi:hypothetical protein